MTSIITGDIINSRNIAAKSWLTMLKTVFDSVGKSPKTWEIFRGDSFQIEIKDITTSLLFAYRLKTTIKTQKDLDVRLAIGIGVKNFDADTITQSNGEAFINSGDAFDTLKKQTLAIKSPWETINEELNVSIGLALLTMDNWTVNSAEFVKMCIENPNLTQKRIASKLNISESSASERRKRAGLDEIMKLENRYRNLIEEKIKNL